MIVDSKLAESQIKILLIINEDAEVSKKTLAENIGISTTAIDKNIKKLKSLGILQRIGADRGGYWEIVKKDSK